MTASQVYGERVQPLPTAEAAERQAPHRSPEGPGSRPHGQYWLIMGCGPGGAEALAASGKLAVFSFREEAETFLAARAPGGSSGGSSEHGWRVREFFAGELISTLYGPLRGFSSVALDPLTEAGEPTMDGLLSVSRQEFVELLVRRAPSSSQDSPEADPSRTMLGVQR